MEETGLISFTQQKFLSLFWFHHSIPVSFPFVQCIVKLNFCFRLLILMLKYCSPSNLFQIQLRGILSHIQQLRIGDWGLSSIKAQSVLSHGLPSPLPKDASSEDQQPAEATGVGRNWVQSMFSREASSRTHSFSRVRKWTSDGGSLDMSIMTLN